MAVYLLSCVAKKRDAPCAARHLYQSALFKKARAYAEPRAEKWWILSAEHGLVDPDEVIAPYDKTLNNMPIAARREWAERVWNKLIPTLKPGEEVVFLAGARYRVDLETRLEDAGFKVSVPMRGLQIGYQLSWLGRQ